MAAYLIMVEERYNDDETHRYLREARRLALEEKDYRSLWSTHYYEGIAKTFNCEFAEGEASFLRLMEMAEASGDLRMLGIVKLNISGYVYAFWGRINQALKCGQEALQLALQADDIHVKGMAYNVCGLALFKKGPVFGGGRKPDADV